MLSAIVPAAVLTENILPRVGLRGLLAVRTVSRYVHQTLADSQISGRYQWSRQRALDLIKTILKKLPQIANHTLTAEDPAVAFDTSLAQLVRDVDPGSDVFADSVTGTFTPGPAVLLGDFDGVFCQMVEVHDKWRVVIDVEGSLYPGGVARRPAGEDSDLSRLTIKDIQENFGESVRGHEEIPPEESVGKVFIHLEMDNHGRRRPWDVPGASGTWYQGPWDHGRRHPELSPTVVGTTEDDHGLPHFPLIQMMVLVDGRGRVRDRNHREVRVRGNRFDIDDEDRAVQPRPALSLCCCCVVVVLSLCCRCVVVVLLSDFSSSLTARRSDLYNCCAPRYTLPCQKKKKKCHLSYVGLLLRQNQRQSVYAPVLSP